MQRLDLSGDYDLLGHCSWGTKGCPGVGVRRPTAPGGALPEPRGRPPGRRTAAPPGGGTGGDGPCQRHALAVRDGLHGALLDLHRLESQRLALLYRHQRDGEAGR